MRRTRALRGACLLAAVLPLAASERAGFSVRVIDDPGPAAACQEPASLPGDASDVNRMPQAEVSIDVAADGRVAAAAKDFRYSPTTSTRYNDGVWNGLYLSADGGSTWRNVMFDDTDSRRGLSTVTLSDLGQAPGQSVALSLETDPVVAFDGEGNLYTSALALGAGAGAPTAVLLTRRDPQGRVTPQRTYFFGTEADPRLDNDKNWVAVEREARADEAVVAQTWRVFTYGPSPPTAAGGYLAVSADGARSFGAVSRLPVPAADAADSQFYQPLVGRDPAGRRTLFVFFTVSDARQTRLEMHLLRADLEGTRGDTNALAARLSDSAGWTLLPRRLTSLLPFEKDGYGGDFRVASYFHPALDPDTGELWVSFHALPPGGGPPRVFVSRSADGGESWLAPVAVDAGGGGAQLLPAVAARGGLASVVWYDSRNGPAYVPGASIQVIDVYYAELEADLRARRLLRLTPESQAVVPLFTRPRVAGTTARGERRPHDADPADFSVRASLREDCDAEPYGFLGDYLGLAVDASTAYAAWGDLRDRSVASSVCAGHDCRGNRNSNVWFAQIPR